MKNAFAAVWQWNGGIYIHAYSVSVTGMHVSSEPFTSLAEDVGDGDLAVAISTALDASATGVPMLKVSNDGVGRLQVLVGSNSWQDFLRFALSVSIKRNGEGYQLSPSRAAGGLGGRKAISGAEIVVHAEAAPQEFGAAVRQAIARCSVRPSRKKL